jgi:aminoglycoside phosphotransferase (APT) family kinase protein
VQNELNAGRTHPVLQLAVRGWEQFNTAAPAQVRRFISSLQHDPSRLLAVLNSMPQTLLHGDYKVANLGMSASENPSTIVLDWQDAARGPGVLDLGYFLALNARWLPFSRERAIELYCEAMADLNKSISPREIEIGLLAGGALRLLWLLAGGEQEDLDWWYEHVLRAGSELDHA